MPRLLTGAGSEGQRKQQQGNQSFHAGLLGSAVVETLRASGSGFVPENALERGFEKALREKRWRAPLVDPALLGDLVAPLQSGQLQTGAVRYRASIGGAGFQ